MDKESILKIKNLSITINKEEILKNINLEILSNQIFLIYGPRNSGKSVLLRSIVDLNEELFSNIDEKGKILLQGKDIKTFDKRQLRSQIAYVEPTFVDNINFLKLSEVFNLALGLKLSEISKEQFSILNKLKLSHIFSEKTTLKKYENFENWTIGDKVSLIIFLSIVRNPQVFIFDSILDHLDDFLLNNIKDFLFEMKEERTLIISTRNLFLFSDIAEEVAFLTKGELLFNGKINKFILNFPI
ncbi:ATP-binding cassette domain-containing protein [Petrotoga sp. 9PWA.NaAc.5.4]|uniref:ATP-binding cassette domain-containing protein n=1 Tax=Petrotoga sp. 9PWA.NaAc.5.4 TaxID=1434328 RepID=UPI000CAA7453|nr:ATP-binding cassette domain-containing protein [Petrotoga sp. 9PWA.NaAc.5.4]PNR95800.1 hypothetical protein X924_03770 [Petrotoga sp. 9PWA.NaAc.5.4]